MMDWDCDQMLLFWVFKDVLKVKMDMLFLKQILTQNDVRMTIRPFGFSMDKLAYSTFS